MPDIHDPTYMPCVALSLWPTTDESALFGCANLLVTFIPILTLGKWSTSNGSISANVCSVENSVYSFWHKLFGRYRCTDPITTQVPRATAANFRLPMRSSPQNL